MADPTPREPDGGVPDPRPRLGPNGERVSEDGHYYWTGRHWELLGEPFAPLAGAGHVSAERGYDTAVVAGVAIVGAVVLSVLVGALVFAVPATIVIAPVLVVGSAVFLGLAKTARQRSWAVGLLIGSGVALLISPGAACFGLFIGPSA